jgi:hypothetical protein
MSARYGVSPFCGQMADVAECSLRVVSRRLGHTDSSQEPRRCWHLDFQDEEIN